MTNEEAIALLKQMQISLARGTGKVLNAKALWLAISALEEQTERECGRWFYGENEQGQDGYWCAKCGKFFPWIYKAFDIDFIKEFNYCPFCGEMMKEENDETD